MKKIFTILTVGIITNLTAQNNFSKGFDEGFKQGYCQDKTGGCIAPIPPISPIPTQMEDMNSYKDGYNRGFRTGLSASTNANKTQDRSRYKTTSGEFIDNKMYDSSNLIGLKLQTIQILVDRAMESYQEEDYNKTIEISNNILKVQSNALVAYVLKSSAYLNQNNLLGAYNNAVKAYRIDSNQTSALYEKVHQRMYDNLSELMSNKYYSSIKAICDSFWIQDNLYYYFMGLSYYYQNDEKQAKKYFKKVKNHEPALRYLSAIESKIKIENPFILNNKDIFSNKELIARSTVDNAPILDKPTVGEGEIAIGKVNNNKVEIIEKAGEYYYKVKSGSTVGYLWVGWLKD